MTGWKPVLQESNYDQRSSRILFEHCPAGEKGRGRVVPALPARRSRIGCIAARSLLGERSVALAEANRLDIGKAPEFGLSEAAIDRLRLTPERIAAMAKALESVALLPEPIGRGDFLLDPPQRAGSAKSPRAAGRGLFHLRIAAERDGRCRFALREGRQRGDPSRRQGSDALERGDCRNPLRSGGRRETAHRCRATRFDARPRGGGPFAENAGVHQRVHSARRRESDPPGERRGENAGHQAFRRQLPRLSRPLGRPRNGRKNHRQRQMPADGRVQRGRIAAGSCRGGGNAVEASRQGIAGTRHRIARRRSGREKSCPRRNRRPKRIIARSISGRSCR